MLPADRPRQRHRSDELAALQGVVELRCIAGQPVEVGHRDRPRRPLRVHRLHRRVKHPQRHRHVAGKRRDARVGRADHRQLARIAADRGAARPWLALVAGHVGVVEIRAAGALKDVAGGAGLVAQLAAGARQDRTGQHAIVAPHAAVRRQRRIREICPDAEATVAGGLDPVELQVLDIDEVGRRLDLQLHQVEQVGAASDELGARPCRHGSSSLRRRLGAAVGEGLHASAPATSVIASRMLE